MRGSGAIELNAASQSMVSAVCGARWGPLLRAKQRRRAPRHSALRALTRFCSARSAATALRCSHRLVPSISMVTAPPLTQTAQRVREQRRVKQMVQAVRAVASEDRNALNLPHLCHDPTDGASRH